jgi:hypothetical protein
MPERRRDASRRRREGTRHRPRPTGGCSEGKSGGHGVTRVYLDATSEGHEERSEQLEGRSGRPDVRSERLEVIRARLEAMRDSRGVFGRLLIPFEPALGTTVARLVVPSDTRKPSTVPLGTTSESLSVTRASPIEAKGAFFGARRFARFPRRPPVHRSYRLGKIGGALSTSCERPSTIRAPLVSPARRLEKTRRSPELSRQRPRAPRGGPKTPSGSRRTPRRPLGPSSERLGPFKKSQVPQSVPRAASRCASNGTSHATRPARRAFPTCSRLAVFRESLPSRPARGHGAHPDVVKYACVLAGLDLRNATATCSIGSRSESTFISCSGGSYRDAPSSVAAGPGPARNRVVHRRSG